MSEKKQNENKNIGKKKEKENRINERLEDIKRTKEEWKNKAWTKRWKLKAETISKNQKTDEEEMHMK